MFRFAVILAQPREMLEPEPSECGGTWTPNGRRRRHRLRGKTDEDEVKGKKRIHSVHAAFELNAVKCFFLSTSQPQPSSDHRRRFVYTLYAPLVSVDVLFLFLPFGGAHILGVIINLLKRVWLNWMHKIYGRRRWRANTQRNEEEEKVSGILIGRNVFGRLVRGKGQCDVTAERN